MKIVKRDGKIVDYNPDKIRVAIEKANQNVSKRERASVEQIEEIIAYIEDLHRTRILVEDIQNIIEEQLMMLARIPGNAPGCAIKRRTHFGWKQ